MILDLRLLCFNVWIYLSSSYLNFLDVCIRVFHQIWGFFTIVSSNILSAPFSLLFLGTPIMLMLVCLMVSHRSLKFCLLFFNLFLSQSRKFLLSYLQVYWLFLLPDEACCWIPLVNFSTQLLYFSAPEFISLLYFFSLLIFSICSCIIFLISISSLSIFNKVFLNVFV